MYFFTQSGKKDASYFAQVATFFIDKFPAAFGATATYFNSKNVNSEDSYIRIDVAAKVTYNFEGHEQHAQSFAPFQASVLDSFKKNSDGESAICLLELLLSQKSNILQLPTSVRQAECTIQRFYLLLMPLLNMAEGANYEKTKTLASQFFSLLVDSQYSLKIKVDALVQLYNSVHNNTGVKAIAFEQLVELCLKENCCDIIVERARKIVDDSASWNLTKEERRQLYQKIGRVLDQLGESSHAFKVIHAYLKMYDAAEASAKQNEIEADARRCVILAIKAVDVINFAEIEDLAAVKQLTQKHAKVFSLLSLFTQASAQEFKAKLNEYKDLMKNEGLTEQELIVKKSYVQICTLNTQVTNFSFQELSQLLNVSACPFSVPFDGSFDLFCCPFTDRCRRD